MWSAIYGQKEVIPNRETSICYVNPLATAPTDDYVYKAYENGGEQKFRVEILNGIRHLYGSDLHEGGESISMKKIDECKAYLREHGLRLTGSKPILVARIREHLRLKDGSGPALYPRESFTINCKGDACIGDIILFTQEVYDHYDVALRSSYGGPIGEREIAGRIVKESYGAEKQQHTFTVEVLWCIGVRPLPILSPLRIKGRNLYRLKTMRQPWLNEEERKRILNEKHTRGTIARMNRNARLTWRNHIRSNNERKWLDNHSKGDHSTSMALNTESLVCSSRNDWYSHDDDKYHHPSHLIPRHVHRPSSLANISRIPKPTNNSLNIPHHHPTSSHVYQSSSLLTSSNIPKQINNGINIPPYHHPRSLHDKQHSSLVNISNIPKQTNSNINIPPFHEPTSLFNSLRIPKPANNNINIPPYHQPSSLFNTSSIPKPTNKNINIPLYHQPSSLLNISSIPKPTNNGINIPPFRHPIEPYSKPITSVFRIEARHAGYVIGKQGKNVNKVTRDTGALVSVRSASKDPRGDCVLVLISGKPSQIEEARFMVQQFLPSCRNNSYPGGCKLGNQCIFAHYSI